MTAVKLQSLYRLRFLIPLVVVGFILLLGTFEVRERLNDQEQQFLQVSRNVMMSQVRFDYGTSLAQARQEAFSDTARQAVIFVCFALVLSALLHALITRRIERLLAVIEQVADGNLSARTGIRGRSELAQVAQAFDRMADQLMKQHDELHEQAVLLEEEVAERQAAQENLQEQAIQLEEEIAERRMVQLEIRALNEQLEQRVAERTAQLEAANTELEAFSYSVSHDLRTPLRGIDGFSQALLEDYAEVLDEQGKDYLRRVRDASQRMALLIDDMLKLSRVTRSDMTVEAVDLSALARSVAEELQRTQPERQVVFVIPGGLTTRGDQRLLRAALENLLGNAWKFTGQKQQPVIEFGCGEGASRKTYFVRDNGAGFDMAYGDKLFVPFQRLHGHREFIGTGIGLSIVQRIMIRHGGRIWAEGAPGKGATFYFTLSAD
jgi:signal transduction histidine kinase